MDRMIAEMGEGGALSLICTRIAEGEDPRDIARASGMPWMVMRRWMEDREERVREWELAKRCFADGLVYEGLREVRDCGLEQVPLARLRSESYGKMAAKISRVEWGDREERASGFGSQGITIVIGSVVAPGLVEAQPGALVVQEAERVPEQVEI
jgi:hypothetical protein